MDMTHTHTHTTITKQKKKRWMDGMGNDEQKKKPKKNAHNKMKKEMPAFPYSAIFHQTKNI